MKQQNKQIYKTNIEKNRQRDRIKIEIKTNQPKNAPPSFVFNMPAYNSYKEIYRKCSHA